MLVLDAGALIAIERGDDRVFELLRDARDMSVRPKTHGGIVGQVWRGKARQARLARALPAFWITPLDAALGRRAGLLLAAAGTSDVVDAALVLLAQNGDRILTSDPDDIALLADAADLDVDVIRV
jgi:hypothetical protein